MRLIPELIGERMRELGWHESNLFGRSYTRGDWCVGVWSDGWTLARATEAPGVYKIVAGGAALRGLRIALLNVEQIFKGDASSAANH